MLSVACFSSFPLPCVFIVIPPMMTISFAFVLLHVLVLGLFKSSLRRSAANVVHRIMSHVLLGGRQEVLPPIRSSQLFHSARSCNHRNFSPSLPLALKAVKPARARAEEYFAACFICLANVVQVLYHPECCIRALYSQLLFSHSRSGYITIFCAACSTRMVLSLKCPD